MINWQTWRKRQRGTYRNTELVVGCAMRAFGLLTALVDDYVADRQITPFVVAGCVSFGGAIGADVVFKAAEAILGVRDSHAASKRCVISDCHCMAKRRQSGKSRRMLAHIGLGMRLIVKSDSEECRRARK